MIQKEQELVSVQRAGFRHTFSEKHGDIIAEIKPKSPTIEIKISPESLMRNIRLSWIQPKWYSVLIDREDFWGDVHTISLLPHDLPVLYKEFIVDKKQIIEAKYFGYSAILLIYKMYNQKNKISEFYEFSQSLWLEAIMEVDNERDFLDVCKMYKKDEILLALNSRNLSTLEIDKSFHQKMYENHPEIFRDYVIFAFSGINTIEDIQQYNGKYNGVLIGSLFHNTKLRKEIISYDGYFWEFWWAYIPELISPIIKDVQDAFFTLKKDKKFLEELHALYKNYIGRPSPLVYAENLSRKIWGAQIYLKNEWVNHTWAHKINHCVWQALIAKYLWKKRIIAETWAWQHGLATASICAKLWLECIIYMGKKDYERQKPNVIYMELAWATVIPVLDGSQTLRDAVNAALKDLLNNSETSYYLLGTACWPNPYPSMNVFFQKIIWEEVRKQSFQLNISPDYLVACVWWGSNSLGLFYEFLDDWDVKMIGVEAWGKGIYSWKHAVRFAQKEVGYVEWYKSYFLQDEKWQIQDTYSISAGLDYSWVSPQISYLENIWRLEMSFATDEEALHAVKTCMMSEGILPALESAHGLAHVLKLAKTLPKEKVIICNISWRWEKDLFITAPNFSTEFIDFIKEYAQKYD